MRPLGSVRFRVLLALCLMATTASAQPLFRGVRARVERGSAAAPIGFRAVGWMEDSPGLRVRASADGVTWSGWQTAAEGADRLVFFGELQRYLEVDSGSAVEMLFIDPGTTTTEMPKAGPARGAEAGGVAPPVVPRAQWGCTPATCPAKDPPVYTTVTHLIVHHTAGANTASDWAAVVRSIWVLHVMGNGWNDIGYNYLVDPNGVLYEGRAGGDGVMGAHFSGVNSGTMGVSMIGTYSTLPLAEAARTTLRTMLAWQAGKWNADPSGKRLHTASGLTLDVISGHRDANNSRNASGTTECPGNGLYTIFPALRREVETLLLGACRVDLSIRGACVTGDGGEIAVRVSTGDGCGWNASADSDWLRVRDTEQGVATLLASRNSGARRSAAATIGGHSVVVTQAGASEGRLACVAFNGVQSIAGGGQPVAAGSWISIYGTGLTTQDGVANPAAPPKILGGTSVAVNGRAAALSFVSGNQVNAQIPPETGIGAARMVVTADGVAGPETMFAVTEAAPAMYVFADMRAIAQNYDDGKRNSPEAPARAGSVVTVYLTGAGTVRGFPAGGTVTPLAALPVTLPWSAAVGGRAAGTLYLGLAPGLVGVYQANLVVPADLAAGDYPLTITVAGATSAPAALAVGGN